MMLKAWFFAFVFSGCSALAAENREVPVYDYNWEDMDADYDAVCDAGEYEKPSQLTIWLRSLGGALYSGICSARDYVIAKYAAIQKALFLKKRNVPSPYAYPGLPAQQASEDKQGERMISQS